MTAPTERNRFCYIIVKTCDVGLRSKRHPVLTQLTQLAFPYMRRYESMRYFCLCK